MKTTRWIEQSPRLLAWYRASRPRTLTAAYVPLALAAVIALDAGVFDLVRFLLSLVGALALQIGANLVNEYFDYRRGADALKVAGQGMVIKQQVLTPEQVFAGAVVSVGSGVILGLILLVASGPLLFWIGLGGVLVVITYTAGPFPLAYNGLGEAAVFIFMGPLMVLGAYYAMSGGQTSETPVLAALPVAFLVAAIMLANNIRDVDADRAANKRTLAVIFGRRFAQAGYIFLVGGAYVALALLTLAGVIPWPGLIAFLTLPEAARLMRIVTTSTDTPLLHLAQGRTARLHRDFGLLLAVGWLVYLLLRGPG